MSKYQLPTGRQVSLVRFAMEPTYEGCLEGSLSSISRHIRKEDWIRQRASRLLPRRLPLIVVDSPDEELPAWFCVAELNSMASVRQDVSDYASRLNLCWFMADTSQSLDTVLKALLPSIDWEGTAEDYDITSF